MLPHDTILEHLTVIKCQVRATLKHCGFRSYGEFEDISQEVVEILLTTNAEINQETAAAYIKAVARNRTIDHLRKLGYLKRKRTEDECEFREDSESNCAHWQLPREQTPITQTTDFWRERGIYDDRPF